MTDEQTKRLLGFLEGMYRTLEVVETRLLQTNQLLVSINRQLSESNAIAKASHRGHDDNSA